MVREVHVPTCSLGQPRLDLGVFVRAVVVDDAVDVELGGYRFVDRTQERQELLMQVPGLTRSPGPFSLAVLRWGLGVNRGHFDEAPYTAYWR